MIPEFTALGLLPAGVHPASWKEFSQRFIVFRRSDRRLRLSERRRLLYDDIRSSGIVTRFLIVGSFVTNADEPNDFDCLLALSPGFVGTDLPPFQYNFVSRRTALRLFRGDVITAVENSDAWHEYLEFFQKTRDEEKMGIVEIE